MSSFLRGKQTGFQIDLSDGVSSSQFGIEEIIRYGISSRTTTLAYDPVQSLLAIGTCESQYDNGRVYIFGQGRVCVSFSLPRPTAVKEIKFCNDKLAVVDVKNELIIFCLKTEKVLAAWSPPGALTAITADPTLDWVFLGLQSGEVIVYDLDRLQISPYRIPNLWADKAQRVRLPGVVSLQLHPRDIGNLLIGYSEGAVIYSFKQQKSIMDFQYVLPNGAAGGEVDPAMMVQPRKPKLTQATWHPTGTFVLTLHEDSSMVIWDLKEGRVVLARSMEEGFVDQPGRKKRGIMDEHGGYATREPIRKLKWCCNANPDDTAFMIAGGQLSTAPNKGLTFMQFGGTPMYATSSWDLFATHFSSPRQQNVLSLPPGAEAVDFCLIPRSSPHFEGAQDPVAVLALLSSGELVTMSVPSGFPISPTNTLHPSISFVHPFINRINLAPISRQRWLGLKERRNRGPPIAMGGAEGITPFNRLDDRNIIVASHCDGFVRLWDIGRGLENTEMIEVDVARAVDRVDHVNITDTSFAGATGELSVGLHTGEVAVFRWDTEKNNNRPPQGDSTVVDIRRRADPALIEGLFPLCLLEGRQGPVTSVKTSDVGFIAVGYESGVVAIVDLRGPATIFHAHLDELVSQSAASHKSMRKASKNPEPKRPEWVTFIEFGVLTLDGEEFSSICCFMGTNLGKVLTFKILPEPSGAFRAVYAGVAILEDYVVGIWPINIEMGTAAFASQAAVAGLREGKKVSGSIVVTTRSTVRIFKPVNAKGASKAWENFLCEKSAVVRVGVNNFVLTGVFGDATARSFSLPGLRQISSLDVSKNFDRRRLGDCLLTGSGNVLGWAGPSEISLITVVGPGGQHKYLPDKLYNPEIPFPPRPTISNLQWIAGVQHVSSADLDKLIGGSKRPQSERAKRQQAIDATERAASKASGSAGDGSYSQGPAGAAPGNANEGYWGYMTRQITERTDKINIMGDSMERLEEGASNFADEVGKFVGKQKRKILIGSVTSKFS